MDRADFMKGVIVSQAYWGKLPDEMLNLYFEHLRDLSKEQFDASVEYLIRNYKYRQFPLIADFRQGIGDTEENQAQAAIGRLKTIAARGASTNSVDFGDPALNKVAETFGTWEALVFWQPEDWNINFQRMIELYKTYSRTGQGIDHIAGYYELNGHDFKIVRYGEDCRMLPEPEPVKKIEGSQNNVV